ncbi:MAG: MarR family winged helix-turn-helix transcriptional regulator [Alphaproteobacteria bacterium]|nr:MarR family winged helix-turn-helix transcriptional regulator [Alphaproteobacteria bacterium]
MSQTKRASRAAPNSRHGSQAEAGHYPTAESTGFLVRAANRAFQRALEERITLRGVTPGQWYFLRVLWEQDGVNQRELSGLVGMTEPTTVVALNSMEKAKLIRRQRSTSDKRKVHIFLTQKGKRLRGVMLPLAEEVNEIARNGVSAEDNAAMRRALTQMIENLEAGKGRDRK